MSPVAPLLAPERDERFKSGRAKRAAETYYCIPGCPLSTVGSRTLDANRDYYTAWRADTPLVIDQLAAEVVTANGTNFRIGFYRANADWQPIGAPLADSGNLSSASTGVKTYTPGTPIYVGRGRYVSITNTDSIPGMRAYRGGPNTAVDSAIGASGLLAGMDVSRAYAAFPTPGTTWDTDILSNVPQLHVVFYRVLTP